MYDNAETMGIHISNRKLNYNKIKPPRCANTRAATVKTEVVLSSMSQNYCTTSVDSPQPEHRFWVAVIFVPIFYDISTDISIIISIGQLKELILWHL